MDQLSETTRKTVEALMRDWMLWVGILSVVLLFTIYLYFNPRAIEYFTGAKEAPKKPEEKKGQVKEPVKEKEKPATE